MTHQIYASIEGQKQGKFQGETRGKAWKIRLVSAAFDIPVSAPRDAASGQASGKRQHKPITIVKEWGASSPQIFQAFNSGEILSTITIDWATPGAGGIEWTYRTVNLSDATIVAIRPKVDFGGSRRTTGTHELLEIQLTFQKIEIQNKDGKGAIEDDWEA